MHSVQTRSSGYLETAKSALKWGAAAAGVYLVPGGPLVQAFTAVAMTAGAWLWRRPVIVIADKRIALSPAGVELGPQHGELMSRITSVLDRFAQAHPSGTAWSPPLNASEVVPPPATVPLNVGAEPAAALGANPTTEEVAWRPKTDQEIDVLIQHVTFCSELYFLHVKCLGLQFPPGVLLDMAREAYRSEFEGRSESLTTLYMRRFGSQLSWYQKLGFYFFRCFPIHNLIRGSLESFFHNFVREFRYKLATLYEEGASGSEASLEPLFKQAIGHLHSFFVRYNGAIREYASANPPKGSMRQYCKEVIQTLNGKTLAELCQEFTTTAIDNFFPRIPLFEEYKKNRFVGWFFSILDATVGALINYVGLRLVKRMMPDTIRSVVEQGIAATDPTNLPFVKAVYSTIRELLVDFNAKPLGSTSARAPAGTDELADTVSEFLDTLALALVENDSQSSLQQIIKKMNEKGPHWLHTQVQGGIVRGILAFFSYLQDNPNALEKLFCQMFRLFNKTFAEKSGLSRADLLDQCDQEATALAHEAGQFFEKIINTVTDEMFRGKPDSQANMERAVHTHIANARRTLEELRIASRALTQSAAAPHEGRTTLIELSHVAQTLQSVTASHFKTLQRLPLSEAAKQGFDSAFALFHATILRLAELNLGMQNLRVLMTNESLLAKEFAQINAASRSVLAALRSNPIVSGPMAEFLDALSNRPHHLQNYVAKNAEDIRRFDAHVQRMKATNRTFETAREGLSKIQSLAGPDGTLVRKMEALKGIPRPGFSSKEAASELSRILNELPLSPSDRAHLKQQIETLPTLKRDEEIAVQWNSILKALTHIETFYQRSFEASKQSLLTQIEELRSWAAERQSAYTQRSEGTHQDLIQKATQFHETLNEAEARLNKVQPERQSFPLQRIPKSWVQTGVERLGIKKSLMQYFDKSMKLVTSEWFYEAMIRIALSTVTQRYKKS